MTKNSNLVIKMTQMTGFYQFVLNLIKRLFFFLFYVSKLIRESPQIPTLPSSLSSFSS